MKVATDVRNMKPYLYDLSNGMVKFGKDYTFINANNEQAVKCAIGLYQKLLSQYVPEDILVLSAFNKGDCGTIAINKQSRKLLIQTMDQKNVSNLEIRHITLVI